MSRSDDDERDRDADDAGATISPRDARELARDDELPVVARLIVEVRSDGSRTIARGGIEDLASGHKVTIDARGDSPAQLALALARSIFRLPQLAGKLSVRGLLGRGRREK